VSWRIRLGLWVFLTAVAGGSWLGTVHPEPGRRGMPLVADLHVHPFPGDGALTISELQREAARRGVDVIAVTGHNNQAAWRLAQAATRVDHTEVIVLPGQEVTNPRFHLVAVGIPRPVAWDQDARAVIDEIHALGGAAVAAHPGDDSWIPRDPGTLSRLDGAEVAHPSREEGPERAGQIDRFFAAAGQAQPGLAAVGSSDFHMGAPLGRCRTFVFADERSAAGVIRALRTGQTVAEDAAGRLFGPAHLVALVTPELQARRTHGHVSIGEKACALAALLGLALLSAGSAGSRRGLAELQADSPER
jgi:predicted metal-dependent phosphoesterase TrpH